MATSTSTHLQGLQDFYQTIAKNGVSRDFQFRILQLGDSKFGNDALLYIRSGSIPGREIQTDAVYFRGFKFNVPLTSIYSGSDGWDVEIIMDKKCIVHSTLDAWHRTYFNEHTLMGRDIPNDSNIIELCTVGDNLEITKNIKLYGCFPVKLGDVKYNMGGSGNIVSFSMTLAYQYWSYV